MTEYIKLQMLRYSTLRAYRSGDWRKIPITENHDPLVEVPSEISHAYYVREMRLGDHEKIYVRSQVLERLFAAQFGLQSKGFDIKLYDGWRSVALQENLFWHYMYAFTAARFNQKKHFDELKDFDEIRAYFETLPQDLQTTMREANRTYVSWPSRDPIAPSPHATGGAVDVWLFQDDLPINLGTPFDWMEEDAGTFYHLKLRRKRFPGNDRRVCTNRTQLILAMAQVGFTCYPPEFWHFNFGNQMDALVKGGPASYSYIEPS